jgi:hypothetical protein
MVRSRFAAAALAAGLSLGFALAGQAAAVHLDPHGAGQVLLYPYYTVNQGQQTYLTVANTSDRAKAMQIDFREGIGGMPALSLRVYLGPHDTWTGTVLALADAVSGAGEGVAVMSADGSCTSPSFATQAHGAINGVPYLRFSTAAYQGDPGPQGEARTREGHVEIVALADLTGTLAAALARGPGGEPADCAALAALHGPTAETGAPDGALVGHAAVIRVAEGTYFPYRATALAGFTTRVLLSSPADAVDPLGEAGDPASGAAAHVLAGGRPVEAAYPADRRIDAVSAALMADRLLNDHLRDAAIGAHSDWVVTFPTKRFYTKAGVAAIAPFVESFGSEGSCVSTGLTQYDREGRIVPQGGFGAPATTPSLCRTTNVIAFLDAPQSVAASGVLGSRLLARDYGVRGTAGPSVLNLDGAEAHALRPSVAAPGVAAGRVFRGLPAIGFWASSIVNAQVAEGVLSNYAGVVPHVPRVTCTQGTAMCD